MNVRLRSVLRQALMLGLGLGLVAALVSYVGFGELRDGVSLDPAWALAVLPATIGIIGSAGIRWRIVLGTIDREHEVGWITLAHYFGVSRLFGYVVPKDLSDVVGRTAWLARRHQVPLGAATLSILLDRGLDLLVVAAMAGTAVLYWLGGAPAETVLVLMLGASVALSLLGAILGTVILQPGVLVINWARSAWAGIRNKPPGDPIVLERVDRRTAGVLLAVSFAKFWFTVGRNIAIAHAVGAGIAELTMCLATPVGQVTYVFAFTPGGLGIFEAGWIGILRAAGVALPIATAFALGQRLLTLLAVGATVALSTIIRSLAPEPRKRPDDEPET